MLDVNIRMSFSEPPEPGCTPAEDIPIRNIVVTALDNAQVKSVPDSRTETIRIIPVGSTARVNDCYIPDPVGFGDEQERWYPLSDGSGYIAKSKISTFAERLVISEFYKDEQRYLEFNDSTCLAVPKVDEMYTVPSDGKFKRAAHDWERSDLDRVRNSPETVPMWDKPDFFDLREDWQELWDKLIAWAAHRSMTDGQLKTAWADITAERKALTDNHGLSHGFTDYILGIYLENNKPMKQKGLVFGGTMMKIRFGSTIYALDPSQPAPELPWLLDRPWLWGWCTQITRGVVSSKWPNLKPWGGWGVPFLILGYEEKNTLKSEHLISLENGQIYSPYARE